MLITFECSASGNFSMFDDSARALIRYMGHRDDVPGAVAANDVPHALDALRKALEAHRADPSVVEEEGGSEKVSLRTRAVPLIDMLEAAAAEEVSILWHGE